MAKEKLKKIKALDEARPMGVDTAGMNYPTLYVDDTQMPEIKDWDVSEKYRMIIEVKQKSKSEMSVGGGSERVDARFDIVAYKVIKEKDIGEMDDTEFGEHQAEQLVNKE